MLTATIRLYGETPEIFQDTIIRYDCFMDDSMNVVVSYYEIIIPIMIHCTDIEEDILVGIAEDQVVSRDMVCMQNYLIF